VYVNDKNKNATTDYQYHSTVSLHLTSCTWQCEITEGHKWPLLKLNNYRKINSTSTKDVEFVLKIRIYNAIKFTDECCFRWHEVCRTFNWETLFHILLANVNSCSRSLYAIARPSVVCLSVVCLSVCRLSVVCNARAPYSGGLTFRQYFYGIWYPSHPLTSTENFTEIVPGEHLRRGSW